MLLIVAFVPMVFVAVHHRAGFDTYWRMPLHIFGVVVIVAALRMVGTFIGLPSEKANASLNLLVAPVVAFLWAFLRYRPASQGSDTPSVAPPSTTAAKRARTPSGSRKSMAPAS